MKKIFLTLSFCIGIIFISLTSFSQTDSSFNISQNILDFNNLNTITADDDQKVISASRTSKSISDLPVTIYVVSREEILENNYVTLVDVLKSVPGMRTSQPGSGDLGETFQMRGMLGNNYTKILINNIPIKTSVSEGLGIGGQLPIRQAERIEIIYGPASALYGADATVGVINIITKEPETGIFAQADINLSGENFINFNVGGKAGKNENILKYVFYGGINSSQNLNINFDSDVFKPLSYLDQTNPAIEIGGETVYYSQLSASMINNFGLDSAVYLQNYEGTADSFPVKEIATQSYYSGFELKFKAINISAYNSYRKYHSSIGRSPFLYKYNNPQNFIAENSDNVSLGYNKTFGRFHNTTNATFTRTYLDRGSNFGVTYIPNGDKMYVYYESNNFLIEELITYSYNRIEIIAGLNLKGASDIPQTNYLLEPFDQTEFDLSDITSTITTSRKLENFGKNPYYYYSTAQFIQSYFNFDKLIIMAGFRNDFNSLYANTEAFPTDTMNNDSTNNPFNPPYNPIDSIQLPNRFKLNDGSDASSVSPRIAILYKVDNSFSIRASYGQAFKPPSGNQIFNSIAYPYIVDNDTGYYYAFIPNLALKPEYFSSLEFGIRKDFFNKKIQLDLTIYHNRITNLITISYVDPKQYGFERSVNPDDNPARTYSNSSDAVANLDGINFMLKFNNIIEKYNLDLQLSGTFVLRGNEILSNGDKIDYFRGTPKYIGKIKTSFDITEKMYLKINNYWTSSFYRQFLPSADYYANDYYQTINGYFITDLYAGLRFHKNLNIYFKITNLTNEEYAGIDATGTDIDLQYNPQFQRNISFGITFMLN